MEHDIFALQLIFGPSMTAGFISIFLLFIIYSVEGVSLLDNFKMLILGLNVIIGINLMIMLPVYLMYLDK